MKSLKKFLPNLPLAESKEAQSELNSMLFAAASTQKLYGRKAEDFAAIIPVTLKMLGKYPAEKVTRAMTRWLETQKEFPTPSDIIGLIERNGKPAYSREMYISLSKKDPEHRTDHDWKYMREYEAHQRSGFDDLLDENKQIDLLSDNERMRLKIIEQQAEIRRLQDLLADARKAPTRIVPDMAGKIENTIKFMRDNSASEQDIIAFRATAQQHEAMS